MSDTTETTPADDRLSAFIKRRQAQQLTVERILEHFQEWLLTEHGHAQEELRRKKEEQRQNAPIVASVRHLERASEMVEAHERLCAEVVALEVRYNALEACQLVSSGYYEADLTDANTLALFQECMAQAQPEKWWDYKVSE